VSMRTATALSSPRMSSVGEFGMWVFLASEVLFFSVLFFGYLVTRLHHPLGFAVGSRHTDLIIGSLNTAVLLTSSLTMALAGRSASGGAKRPTTALLAVTAGLGAAFLALKGLEYLHDIQHHLVPWRDFSLSFAPDAGGARLFFLLYFLMTGAHALHLLIGISLLLIVMTAVARGRQRTRHAETVEITGLYWHLVDIVWIFVYPLLYLVSRT
jgi:cytochrome c oxidase subunit 3